MALTMVPIAFGRRVDFDSLVVPNFLLLMYRELPLILIMLLSVPDSTRARLSLRVWIQLISQFLT